jgi:zona occludens toxin (predicted ATPase)
MVTKREQRRSEEIHFYAGTNGGGKSFAAVYDTIPTLQLGRPVLSTVRLLDPVNRACCAVHAEAAWAERGVTDFVRHSDQLALPHPL